MKPVQDSEKVDRMFAQGQPSLTDPQSGYKYSMTARCPKDGCYSPVSQIERGSQGLSRVVFNCPNCSERFEVPRDEYYVV